MCVGLFGLVCSLQVGLLALVWYVAPSCLHVGALPVVLAEVVHGRGEGENLQVGVLPHHGPAPSIQVTHSVLPIEGTKLHTYILTYIHTDRQTDMHSDCCAYHSGSMSANQLPLM